MVANRSNWQASAPMPAPRGNRFEIQYSFGLVQSASREVRTDASYVFNNLHRPDGDSGLVVQRTLQGAGFFSAKGKQVLVRPQFAMLFSHHEPTTYGYPPSAREPYSQEYVEFSDCPALRTIFDKIRNDFGAVVHIPDGCEARDLIDEIIERFKTGHFADRYQESELLYRMLISIYRTQVEGMRRSDPIEFGHHLIRNRFRKDTNLKEIADLCGVSREHFTRVFHRRYGCSPARMLKELRLEHADLLLRTTRIPVADVSAACGFANQNTFARLYKRRYGSSPGSYRLRKQSESA